MTHSPVVVGPDAVDEGQLSAVQSLFDCAMQVYSIYEPLTRPPETPYLTRPLIMYLMTNSERLRKEATNAYPGQIMHAEWPIEHIDVVGTTCVLLSFTFHVAGADRRC